MGVNCLNYKNQEAIDQAIREHNKELGEGLYKEGTNVCGNCLGGLLFGVHRICYKPRLEINMYGDNYAIYDLLKREFAKSDRGEVLTRNTLRRAKKLMAGVERTL